PAAHLERVTDSPTEAQLAAVLGEPGLAGGLGAWGPSLRWELAVDRKLATSPPAAVHLAPLIGPAFRLRTAAPLPVPPFPDPSWSRIAAITGGRCMAYAVEDGLVVRRGERVVAATLADLEWIWPRLTDIAELLESSRFRLAVDALTSHRAEANPRLAAIG